MSIQCPRLAFAWPPKVFNAVADALHWCLLHQGVQWVFHYLDNSLIAGPPGSQAWQGAWPSSRPCAHTSGSHWQPTRDGPTTCLVFLGITIDTVAGEHRLPSDKLQRLRSLLEEWGDRRHYTRKELESLVGLLNHACKVVRLGRSFLRRMFDFLHGTHHPPGRDHFIHLNRDF